MNCTLESTGKSYLFFSKTTNDDIEKYVKCVSEAATTDLRSEMTAINDELALLKNLTPVSSSPPVANSQQSFDEAKAVSASILDSAQLMLDEIETCAFRVDEERADPDKKGTCESMSYCTFNPEYEVCEHKDMSMLDLKDYIDNFVLTPTEEAVGSISNDDTKNHLENVVPLLEQVGHCAFRASQQECDEIPSCTWNGSMCLPRNIDTDKFLQFSNTLGEYNF